MRRRLLVGSILVVACGPVASQTNPCATRGASYLQSFTEQSGNCGPVPSQVINVDPDGSTGTGAGPQISCASSSQTGCTTRRSDCRWSSNGVNYTMTSTLTFAQDGSSATGLMTFSASSSSGGCVETYGLTMVRQ